jgi:hypothetical protein
MRHVVYFTGGNMKYVDCGLYKGNSESGVYHESKFSNIYYGPVDFYKIAKAIDDSTPQNKKGAKVHVGVDGDTANVMLFGYYV